jgi:soluble lytic murein transglycosylase-like protein
LARPWITKEMAQRIQAAAEKYGYTPGKPLPESRLAPLIDKSSKRWGISPHLLRAMIRKESGFDPAAVSKVGAVGLTQLMPGTATDMGCSDAFDPEQAVDGGAKYLAHLVQHYKEVVRKLPHLKATYLELALAGYNAGPGNNEKFHYDVPFAETKRYVATIMRWLADAERAANQSPAKK